MKNPAVDFAENRKRILNKMGEDEAILVFSSTHHFRNADAEYRYRQSSDFYWLSGWTQADAVLFLRPTDQEFTLFCQPKDKEKETWTGVRPGVDGAVRQFGVDAAFPIEELDTQLPKLLEGVKVLHYDFGIDHDHDSLLMASITKATRAAREKHFETPESFRSLSWLLHECRLIKSDAEIEVMKRAVELTHKAHLAAMAAARPGTNERELEAIIDYTFRSEGGNGPGYSSIVASGSNATILHHTDNNREMQEGDLLLIDAGCEFMLYSADVTRTFPVSGKFTQAQREVYDWVLLANERAIEATVAGASFISGHEVAVRTLTEGMVALGLLEGEVDELIKDRSYKRYYMHGTSHWLGLDVHDAGRYNRSGRSRPLLPGMVLTIEPGLYISEDDTDAPEKYRGIGIRIEDDILVTAEGPISLTASIPKTIAGVEAACLT